MNRQRHTRLLPVSKQEEGSVKKPRDLTVSLPAAAQLLGLSWGQAWRLVLKGVLRGRRVGGKWIVDATSVSELVQARTVAGELELEGRAPEAHQPRQTLKEPAS